MDSDEPASILVVDDDPMILELCRELLLEEGYKVWAVTNGRQAVDQVHKRPPTAVLMDIMMPVLDGISACKLLKEDPDTRNIPVALMSAASNLTPDNRNRAGADATLVKPFDIDHLLATVHSLVSAGSI